MIKRPCQFLLVALILNINNPVVAAELKDFYGIWGQHAEKDVNENVSLACIPVVLSARTEGTTLYMDQATYDEGEEGVFECKDLEYWMHGRTMRMTASCATEEQEGNYFPRTVEYDSISQNLIQRKGKNTKYYKCGPPFEFAPSFSCAGKLSESEKAICSDASLMFEDFKIGIIVEHLLALEPKRQDKLTIKEFVTDWRVRRDKCKADSSCIMSYYNGQKTDLNRFILFVVRPSDSTSSEILPNAVRDRP